MTGIVGEVQGSGGREVSKIPESANILLTGLNKRLVSGEQVMSGRRRMLRKCVTPLCA